MAFEHNKDAERREQIIFGESYDTEKYRRGGIRHFDDLTAQQLRQLIDEKFMDPEDCQNLSPNNLEFLEFMEAHGGYGAEGYAISRERNDYRINIEGIHKKGPIDAEERVEFAKTFYAADEMLAAPGELYCWFD